MVAPARRSSLGHDTSCPPFLAAPSTRLSERCLSLPSPHTLHLALSFLGFSRSASFAILYLPSSYAVSIPRSPRPKPRPPNPLPPLPLPPRHHRHQDEMLLHLLCLQGLPRRPCQPPPRTLAAIRMADASYPVRSLPRRNLHLCLYPIRFQLPSLSCSFQSTLPPPPPFLFRDFRSRWLSKVLKIGDVLKLLDAALSSRHIHALPPISLYTLDTPSP
jgi:hypothetical protein